MPAPTRKVQLAEKHIEEAIKELPFYVTEYIRSKKRARYSSETLSGYLHDYKRFFNWLKEEGLTEAEQLKDIPYTVLENLKKKEIEWFFEMLADEEIEKQKDVFVKRSESSLNRFIQSLKSLFNYLTTESEKDDDSGECYFYRNVMAKIKTPKKTESAARRAKRINSNILASKQEIDGFLEFVKHEYINTLTPRQKARFERDRARDIAICSLLLGSGIRVNEIAGMLLTDIDFVKGDITTLRKGNKVDTVSVMKSAMDDLKLYLSERVERYRPDEKNQFVFLTIYGRQANPISIRTIQTLINRYTQAYLKGKRLTPHQFRHSFSKLWLDKGGSLVGLRDQLGHNSIETTVLYTNLSQNEQREILDKMDE